MSDTAEPAHAFREHFEADATPMTAAPRPPTRAGKLKPFGGLGLKAAACAAATPKLTRVACVAFLGLALGGACGLWLRALMAAASLPPRPSALAAPLAPQSGNPPFTSAAMQAPTPEGHDAPAPSHAVATLVPGTGAPLSAEVLGTQPSVTAGEERGEERAAVRGKEPAAAGGAVPYVNARADAAKAASSAPKADAPAPKAAKAAGRPSPCTMYASAGSLALRSGSSAPLILGGPGPFTVTTPNWSDIVVFSDGRAGGGKNGWVKYTVRSVGKRPGVYTLHVKSPCDSQTVRVRVTP